MESTGKRLTVVLRVVGIAHLLFVGYGSYLLGSTAYALISSGMLYRLNRPETPYNLQFYLARGGLNLAFLVALAVAGVLLVRGCRTGVRITNGVYVSMLLYFFASVLAGGLGPLRLSSAASEGIGDRAIHAQLFTGYPIVALIVLNLVRRKLPDSQPAEPTSSNAGG